ncbi:hypothetical protein BDD12DRAFT_367293 [Trichophaea hybrida]|nr:hypothetical protein BDD12DRAFT_367293 [Trichophaea hybrida]
MATARTARNPMAPTAAPQQPMQIQIQHQQHQQHQHQQHQQYQQQPQYSGAAFPSPNSAGHSLSPGFVPNMTIYIDYSYYMQFLGRTIEVTKTLQSLDDKRNIIDQRFDSFQYEVTEEIKMLKNTFLHSQGLPPSTNKRRTDDEDPSSSLHSSPDAKKSRTDVEEGDSPEDEVNTKGAWRCLYYEEDPETHFHCKDKRYKRVSELRRHVKTHTLPHCCNKCGYRTAEERRLQNHKCEPGNRKKYSPVTEEDRIKHEQLARLGIKVGHMRTILFGKKSDAESVNGDDDTEGSENSRRPSISKVNPMQSLLPINFTYQHANPITTTQPQHPNLVAISQASSPPLPMFGSPHLPQQMLPQMPSHIQQMPQQMPPQMAQQMMRPASHTPPFQPGSSMPHSPAQGHAAWYYHGIHQQDTGDFVLYPPATYHPQSPIPGGPLGSEGSSSSSPPLSNHNHQSPPGNYTHQIPYTKAEQDPSPVARVDSLSTFLQDVFPEVDGAPVINRAMPQSEIREMEKNLKKLEEAEKLRNGIDRAGTRTSFLVKVRQNRVEIVEKSRSLLRRLSTHSTGPERRGFWRSWSAPPNLGNDRVAPKDENAATITTTAADATATTATTPATAAQQKKAEGGIVGSLKKVFMISIGKRRPTV